MNTEFLFSMNKKPAVVKNFSNKILSYFYKINSKYHHILILEITKGDLKLRLAWTVGKNKLNYFFKYKL